MGGQVHIAPEASVSQLIYSTQKCHTLSTPKTKNKETN